MSGSHPGRGDVYLTNTGFFFSPVLIQAVLIKSACIESKLFTFSLFLEGKKTTFLMPNTQSPLRTTTNFHCKNWHPAVVFVFISNTPETALGHEMKVRMQNLVRIMPVQNCSRVPASGKSPRAGHISSDLRGTELAHGT